MLSARPRDFVEPVLESWKDINISLMNTSDFSVSYQNTACLQLTFKGRLFAVYQHVIRQILSKTNDISHVVILEDDAKLLDKMAFLSELKWAVENNQEYYSFMRSATSGCLYSHGAVAQVFGKSFLQEILEADNATSCRLPIDMYIAKRGPWFETQRNIIQHIGKRYIVEKKGHERV